MRSTTIIAPLPSRRGFSQVSRKPGRAATLARNAAVGLALVILGAAYLVVGSISYCVRAFNGMLKR